MRPSSATAARAPGKQTLTEALGAPVQARPREATPEAMAQAARHGVSGSGGALPFLDVIQRAFGRHDVTGVRAHTGGAAAEGAGAMGAAAFARGNDVAFAGAPDLHTAAHEAAHVVQQRSGRGLAGGVGQAGDAHERHADQVADAVVAGRSAEPLLDLYAAVGGTGRSSSAAHDRSAWGTAIQHTGTSAPSVFPEIPATQHEPEFHRTSFLARVSLTPRGDAHGGELHRASELWVKDVKLSNDRPPTKFGADGQRSHTVAWSLMREALHNLGGQPLDGFVALVARLFQDLEAPTNQAGAAAAALAAKITAGAAALRDPAKLRDLASWQRGASELLGHVVHAYQLSDAATYADSVAIGHGEPGHMAALRGAEAALRAGGNVTAQIADLQRAAAGMLDFKSRLGHQTIGHILQHWTNDLHLAFPRLMAAHRTEIVAGLSAKLPASELDAIKLALGRDPTLPVAEIAAKPSQTEVTTARGPADTAIPAAHRASFVANVVVVPTAAAARLATQHTTAAPGSAPVTGSVELGHYQLGQLQIDALAVADDRPDTRFGVLQRSHTVAWTLVRRHLMGFGGKPATVLAEFLANELTTLKSDIDTPAQNAKIGFDAPARRPRSSPTSRRSAATRPASRSTSGRPRSASSSSRTSSSTSCRARRRTPRRSGPRATARRRPWRRCRRPRSCSRAARFRIPRRSSLPTATTSWARPSPWSTPWSRPAR